MNVLALIRNVERVNDGSKTKAIVTLETETPLEIHQLRLFEEPLANGSVAAFEQMEGKGAQVPIEIGTYNGKAQINFPRGAVFKAQK